METQFYILFSLKTGKETENFARFFIGNNRKHAYRIFHRLKGTNDVNDKNILWMEFTETKEGLPFNLKMMSCNLDQLAENCKIITKELFKLSILENDYARQC